VTAFLLHMLPVMVLALLLWEFCVAVVVYALVRRDSNERL